MDSLFVGGVVIRDDNAKTVMFNGDVSLMNEMFDWCEDTFEGEFLLERIRIPNPDVWSSQAREVDRIRCTTTDTNAAMMVLRWPEARA
jgi:hypothetical protein